MTRKAISILIGAAVLILCGITAVQAGSGNTLFPDGMVFPNPFHKPVAPAPSAGNVSTGSQPHAASLTESNCPVTTDHLAITDGECEDEQASLYLDGPNALVVKSEDGSVSALGNSGALSLGSTDPGLFTPGALLVAFSPPPEDLIRAGLLLCTLPGPGSGENSSIAWLSAMNADGDATAYLVLV